MVKLRLVAWISFVSICLYGGTIAAPFDTGFIQWSQPNGRTFVARFRGDEFQHWMETQDGYRVTRGVGEWYYYATLDARGEFTPTELRVGVDQAPSSAYKLERSETRLAEIQQRIGEFNAQVALNHQRFMQRQAAAKAAGVPMIESLGVILVEFDDVKHFGFPDGGYPKAKFDSLLFSRDYWYKPNPTPQDPSPHPEGEAVFGSMRDYYWEMSRPNRDSVPPLILTGGVVNNVDANGVPLWIELDHDRDYYLGLIYGDAIIEEAITKATDRGLIQPGQYNSIAVIYAREGINQGALGIHASYVMGYPCYNMSERGGPNVYGNTNIAFNHIGTHAHEYGHCIGFPDEYSGQAPTPLDSYDLMARGNAAGPLSKCECPASLAPYHRIGNGWIRVTTILLNPQNFLVEYDYANPKIYRINPQGAVGNEHFIFETRQRQGFDLYVPTHPEEYPRQPGTLLVWHHDAPSSVPEFLIDDIDLVEADNQPGGDSYSTDFFPNNQTLNVQSFSDTSATAPILGNGELAHFALLGIRRLSSSNTIIESVLPYSRPGFTIQNNTTWAGVKYVSDDVNVVNGATLTLSPGAEIIFRSSPSQRKGLYVQDGSRLVATGTPAQRIRLRSFSRTQGDWTGIRTVGTGTWTIRFCDIHDAEEAISPIPANITLSDLVIQNCRAGFHLTDAGISVSGCVFESNQSSLSINNASPSIRNNVFNRGTVEISIGSSSAPEISNNLFVGKGPNHHFPSSTGISIKDDPTAQPTIKNNTIIAYWYPCLAQSTGGGTPRSVPILKNNIFYLNRWSTFDVGNLYGSGDLLYNNIYNNDREGYDPPNDPPQHFGNIEFDPMFSSDYSLQFFSRSIDAGYPGDSYNLEPEPNGRRINQGHHGNTPQATRSFNIVASGSISENTTWSGNVFVNGDLRVEESGTLTIMPGTKVWVTPGTMFEVYGSLTAIGSPLDSIRFISDNPPEAWYGIVLGMQSYNTTLQYCSIGGASTGITIEPSYQTVLNCIIDGCGVGIDVYTIDGHFEPVIASNEIRNCAFGIYFHQAPLSDVRDNHIHSNDVGVYAYLSNPLFHNNVIENNRGFGVLTEESSPRFGDFLPNDRGCNTIRYNTTHSESADLKSVGGEPFLGYYDGNEIFGGFNNVYSGTGGSPCHVRLEGGAYVRGFFTWWGEDPPRPELFCVNNSKIDYSKPLNGPPAECQGSFAQLSLPTDPEEQLLNTAAVQRGRRNYTGALHTYSSFVANRPNSRFASRALRELRQTYRDFRGWSRDSTLQQQLMNVLSATAINHASVQVKRTALGLLAEEYLSRRDWNRARTAWEQLRSTAANTPFERSSLHSLFALHAYSLHDTASARSILTILKNRFPLDHLTTLAERRYASLTRRAIQPFGRVVAPEPQMVNELPKEYKLYQNYPNPFNPSTTIKFQLPDDGIVTLKVYDILGREVATLVNEVRVAGTHDVTFDASQFASGVYIYRMQSGGFTDVKRILLLK